MPATLGPRARTAAEYFLYMCRAGFVHNIRDALFATQGGAFIITADDVAAAVQQVARAGDVHVLNFLLHLDDARAIPISKRVALAREALLHGRQGVAIRLVHDFPPGAALSTSRLWYLYMDACVWGRTDFLVHCTSLRPLTFADDTNVVSCALEAARGQHVTTTRVWMPHLLEMWHSSRPERRVRARRAVSDLYREACLAGLPGILALLPQAHANICMEAGGMDEGLALACERGHLSTAKYLLEHPHWSVSTHHVGGDDGTTLAEPRLDPLTFERRDDSALPPDEQMQDERPVREYAFVMACQNGHLPVVESLLSVPNVQQRPRIHEVGVDALVRSSSEGRNGVVRTLLALDGDFFIRADARQGAALDHACAEGHLEVVRALCEARDADGNRRVDVNGREGAPLQWAARNGHLPVVQYLLVLDDGAAAHADGANYGALQVACIEGHLHIAEALLGHFLRAAHERPSVQPYLPALYDACARGHGAIVRLMLTRLNPDPHGAAAIIQHCLEAACEQNAVDIVVMFMSLVYANTQGVALAVFRGLVAATRSGNVTAVDTLLPIAEQLQAGPYRTSMPAVLEILAQHDDVDSIIDIPNPVTTTPNHRISGTPNPMRSTPEDNDAYDP